MEESKYHFIQQLCLKSLFHFFEIIIAPSMVSKEERLPLTFTIHKPVCAFADDDSIFRKGFLLPRYFLKSSLLTKCKPILDWLRNPEERILIANEVFRKASEFLGFIKKNFEQNERLHYYFPKSKITRDWIGKHQWSNEAIDLPCEGIYDAPTISVVGVGGARQGLHVHRAYLDDLIGKKAMLSTVVRDDTEQWFNNVPELLVNPYKNWIYLIGTNWAPGDLYESVKQRNLGYQWKVFTAEDKRGEPTWPEKLPKSEIQAMKSDPNRFIIFYTQFQNKPIESGITDFKNDWIKDNHYRWVKVTQDNVESIALEYIRDKEVKTILLNDLQIEGVIDPAGFKESKMKSNARNAIVIVGTDTETNLHFILEAWAEYLSEPEQLFRKVEQFHDKYMPKRWGIETFATQGTILKVLREKARDNGIYLPFLELEKDVGKNAKDIRIRSLQDDFSTGTVYIRADMTDFIGEYLAFPTGSTKDIMDALGYHKVQFWTKVDRKQLQKRADEEFQWYLRNRNPITGT